MPYPVNTFTTFAQLAAYINNEWITNGNEEIDAVIGNDVVNGLLTFIEQSPLNWQKAQVISTGGAIAQTRPISIFITNTPTSLQWVDNIYNQYIFINSTDGAINLPIGYRYYDINLVAKSTIPARTVVSIVKASNDLWISIYNSSTSGTGSYASIKDTISIQGATYTNPNLSGATQLNYVILNKNIYILDDDFTFSGTTLIFTTITLFIDDIIIIPFKSST